ncbi:MAG TPA: hypothetical protein VHA52_13390, partial [Candidatus Babeliaceae bacterium]|nr:hypothetical protein [Candidatus Babeliaceae bacterium]
MVYKRMCEIGLSRGAKVSVALLLMVLFGSTLLWYYKQTKTVTEDKIIRDLEELVTILKNINNNVGILGFQNNQVPIDFLNIVSFTGSTIGGMSVKYP